MTVPVVHFLIAGEEYDAEPEQRPYTVVYDGNCKVCGRLAKVLRKWDRERLFEVVPSQTPGVHARFPWIPARAYAESMQVIGCHGRTWQGAEAIEQLLRVLPKGKLISWIFKLPLIRAVAEVSYRWFARNRYRLGCDDHCQLRPADLDFADES